MGRPSRTKPSIRYKSKKAINRPTKTSQTRTSKAQARKTNNRHQKIKAAVRARKTIRNRKQNRTNQVLQAASIFAFPTKEMPPYDTEVWNRIVQALPAEYKIPDMSIVQPLLQKRSERMTAS